jgi:phosphoglycerate kinase
MKTLDDFKLKGKRVLIRLDLNSSIINNKVELSMRFKEHAKTIQELVKKGAKIVILAHQGKKGESEYLESLEQHAKILSKLIKKKIIYVNDLFGSEAINAINSLKDSQVLMLKNTRSLDDETKKLTPEEHSKTEFVQKLKPYFDLFVQDALSVCHRGHASVVGFAYVLPSCVGRVLQKELENIEKVNKKLKRPFTLILGGVKIEDYYGIMNRYIGGREVDYILTTGAVCLIGALAKGVKLGKEEEFLEKKDLIKEVPKLRAYLDKIEIPIDFAIDINGKRKEISIKDLPSNYPILDIGTKTIKEYGKIIKKSKTIFIKGSAGNYEKSGFEKGTKILLQEIGKSKAFSLVGGGDTTTAIEKYKIKNLKNISLSGGALLEYLAGKNLPGLEVLK